jgi:hypothetical protein
VIAGTATATERPRVWWGSSGHGFIYYHDDADDRVAITIPPGGLLRHLDDCTRWEVVDRDGKQLATGRMEYEVVDASRTPRYPPEIQAMVDWAAVPTEAMSG